MLELKYVNQKVVQFVDATKRISQRIGLKQIRFLNNLNNKSATGNNKPTIKITLSIGSGMFKISKMTKVNILILILILNHLRIIMALLYGKWFMRKIVSVEQEVILIKNKYVNNKPSFIK